MSDIELWLSPLLFRADVNYESSPRVGTVCGITRRFLNKVRGVTHPCEVGSDLSSTTACGV